MEWIASRLSWACGRCLRTLDSQCFALWIFINLFEANLGVLGTEDVSQSNREEGKHLYCHRAQEEKKWKYYQIFGYMASLENHIYFGGKWSVERDWEWGVGKWGLRKGLTKKVLFEPSCGEGKRTSVNLGKQDERKDSIPDEGARLKEPS